MSNKIGQTVVAAADKPAGKVKLGPRVLMSGYMTKKTRAVNTWKQRCWQLKDDGILLYYKPEDPLKRVCGEIDVGNTCYNVKMGSDTQIKFPGAVPSCCCFSFAVLKRVYYVYTPTPGEASSWVSAISGVSRVINRKIVAGMERRKAPEYPGGSTDFRITRVKVKDDSLDSTGTYQDISRVQYLPLERNKLALELKRKYVASMPDNLDKVGIEEDATSIDHSENNVEVIGNSEFGSTSNSLKLNGNKNNELKNEGENSPAISTQVKYLRSRSMDELCLPRSPRKPVPIPRKKKGNDANASSKQSNHQVSNKASNTVTPPVSSHIRSSSLSSKNKELGHLVRLNKNNSSIPSSFSPPSSPPPPPPDEFMPPSPLTSPPHSRQMLGFPISESSNQDSEYDKLMIGFPRSESSNQDSEYDKLMPRFPFPPKSGPSDLQDTYTTVTSSPEGVSCIISEDLARKMVQSKGSPIFKLPPPPPLMS